ncbi:hypothetical protein C8N35_11650 [Breoghania corrubedonensis]|uniref:Scaffolding protein n=1 Tax=Breoghania corrubedonensis TaxID=665038 RepID=A0A2T5UQ15_9HYPH|nr:hypothetical protein [Breoghania corrubedonensis]PTW53595.1 hypothetical protein C8N35_11650 [Breoghania corrubedonensis]
MAKYSDEELELLSDEEREGLMDEELVDDEEEGGQDAGGDEPDETPAGETDGKEESNSEAESAEGANEKATGAEDGTDKADGAKAPADGEAEEAAGAPASDDGPVDEPAPAWTLPPEHKQRIDELNTSLDDLAAKFDEGDLTAQEYREQQRKATDELRELDRRGTVAETLYTSALEGWKSNVGTFMHEHPTFKTGAMYTLLDEEVKRLQRDAQNPFRADLLTTAHENVVRELQTAMGGGKPQPDAKNPGKGKSVPAVPERTDPVPPILRGVPSSEIEDTSETTEFGWLDKLADTNSLEFEKALEKLPPEQRDRYLSL